MIEKSKLKLFLKSGTYILFIGIVIAIALTIYFSFTTKNVSSNSISLGLIAILTFPLGLLISRILFPQMNISETIIISLCIGCPFAAGVWGGMAFLRVTVNPIIYFAVSFALPVSLLICFRKKLKFRNQEININEIGVSVIVLLIAFLWHSLMLANNNVPCDVDAQGTCYLQLLMKYQGYPIVYPFLDETKAYINYPPCFNVIVVLLSKLKMSLVYKECMSVTAVCGSYFALANFLLSYFLTKRNLLLAFVAGVLTLNRAYLTQYNDGNTTEMLSFLSISCFLILLQQALNEGSKKRSIIIAVLAGFVFSVSALSQTEIFNWYAISFVAFVAFYLVSRNKNFLKDYLILTVCIFTCIAFVLPWLINISGNHKTINFENPFDQYATQIVPVLRLWHNPILIILSFIGIGLFFFYRQKIMILLGIHALMMVLLVIHWKFYSIIGFKWYKFIPLQYWSLGANGKFLTPFEFPNTYTIGWMSFATAFPIAAAYTIVTIIEFIRRQIKITCVGKYKMLIIPVVIFLSWFQYCEYRNYFRYPEYLLETDYQALQWFQKNTTFDDCLILNPRNPVKLANGIDYWMSDWIPVVAERRAVSCRSVDTGKEQLNIEDVDMLNKGELIKVYTNILQPDAYNLLKRHNISHIFISALQSAYLIQDYQKAPFLQLVHFYSIPNLGTSLIYAVR